RPAFEALGLVDSGRGSGGRRALVAETTREEKAG
ncbi:MAG: Inner membrane protein yohD, partial [Escherichia coli DORA_A_5_14_21]